MTKMYDVAIIGGGIVGLATAKAILGRHNVSLVLIEAEREVAQHQTGHNSGVIHSGLYYKPGSWKAIFCEQGRVAMYRFCQENDVPHEACGKIVVATKEEEVPALDEMEKRGRANGLNLKRLAGHQIADFEPHVHGVAALWVPETGIADYRQVCRVLSKQIQDRGGIVWTKAQLKKCRDSNGEFVLETTSGEVRAKNIINCAGLQADRVAKICGVEPGIQIVPFRGEYYEVIGEKRNLVRNLIYPVPDARFPFLGVHFTRTTDGMIEAGPNAVLALKREGYSWSDVSFKDLVQMLSYKGFWKMAAKYWKMGLSEMYRSLSKRAFLHALQQLIPDLGMEDIRFAGSGVRAQALDPKGNLVYDFHIMNRERMIHVLNAPSPAATASLMIGEKIAYLAKDWFK